MAKKLKGPLLTGLSKPIPEMPKGYYSGDQPNPNLRSFVEAHLEEKPYEPETDEYDVPAFDRALKATRATALYNMHMYWSKKPFSAIRQYICHYSAPGDLVLDTFSGSGGTALAALLEERKAVAIDRSPAATFITKGYCTPVDSKELRAAFLDLKQSVQKEIDWLYATRCDRCAGEAVTAFTVYSQVFQCPRCLAKVPLFDCPLVEVSSRTGRIQKTSVCPHCHAEGAVEPISTRQESFGAIPVMVSYLCKSGCSPARDERRHNDANVTKKEYFDRYDMAKINEIERKPIPHWFPTDRMMHAPEEQASWGSLYRPGVANWYSVDEVWTKRNRWALAAIRSAISIPGPLGFTFTGMMLNSSRMYRHRTTGGGGPAGSISIPQINREMNVFRLFESKHEDVCRGMEALVKEMKTARLMVSTQSATDISNIPAESIDYVFTDPPYSDKFPYGELNFIWEAWLGLDTRWHKEEIIVGPSHSHSMADWVSMMERAAGEWYRVLKPGRWLSLCYHDTSEGTWHLVQDIMAAAGFAVEKSSGVLSIDAGQKTIKQLIADKVTKRDLVINFRKPKPNEGLAAVVLTGDEDETTFLEKVRDVIRGFLQANPGNTKDRIYDEVVSRLVRRGRMEAFQFDRVLEELADPVESRVMENLFEVKRPDLLRTHVINKWYLKDAADRVDEAEGHREDAAADRLEGFMREFLRANPEKQGVHYSDLFEQVVMLSEKPRRDMADWLWDYFIKTGEGTWRPPATEEEREEKRRQRATGAIRKIKSFARALDRGEDVPERLRPDSDHTLADWIRQARRAGLYQQGRTLFEKGGLNLSLIEEVDENLAMDVNEDYRYCLKQLSEGKGI